MSNIYKRRVLLEKIGSLYIELQSVTVNTNTRRLRAIWTPQLAQDLEAYHNVDAETELENLVRNRVVESRPNAVPTYSYKKKLIIEKHKPNLEQSIYSMLSEELSKSIDREIIRELLSMKKKNKKRKSILSKIKHFFTQ
jgi:hypothetical protein